MKNKEFSVRIFKSYLFVVLFLFAVVAAATGSYAKMTAAVFSFSVSQKTILIDAGHGGWDPGKTGTTGENEKDINLKIADTLQAYLENSGSVVFLTRNKDEALSSRKREDMRLRKELGNKTGSDIVVSIHQNAFPSENVKGAQVFYFKDSEKSKSLAECIQKQLNEFADIENKRIAKENDGYYILKQTFSPAVIVECGFLSNYAEEVKLNSAEYQEKVAWAIYMGIEDYFERLDKEGAPETP